MKLRGGRGCLEGGRSRYWVGVVVTTKTRLRRWPMKKQRCGFQSTQRWIFHKSRRLSSNKCQCCVKLQWFSRSVHPLRKRFFCVHLDAAIARALWHARCRMPAVHRDRQPNCRAFHSQAPSPFITRLFNQLAVTKQGPQPLLMLNTSHLPSIWPFYCGC